MATADDKRPGWLRRTMEDLDLMIGIALTGVVATLGVIGWAGTDLILAVTLAALALILTLFLRLRANLRELDAGNKGQRALLQHVADHLDGHAPIDGLFNSDYPDLTKLIVAADEIFVVAGATLRTSVGAYYYPFRNAVERGVHIRLLCPDPSDDVLMKVLSGRTFKSAVEVQKEIAQNLELSMGLASQGGPESRLEIKVVNFPPYFGSLYFRSTGTTDESAEETLIVKVLPYGYTRGVAPVLKLDPRGGDWVFDTLRLSSENLWNDGRPVEISQ